MSVGPLPALAFDPNAAASYADHHWSECGPSPYNGTPPSPYVCMQNDCTNYASRVLHAGGYSFVLTLGNQWYWYNSSQKTRSWYDASNNSYWTTGDWADQHTEVRYHDFWNGYYQLDATTRRTVQIFQVHIDPLNV